MHYLIIFIAKSKKTLCNVLILHKTKLKQGIGFIFRIFSEVKAGGTDIGIVTYKRRTSSDVDGKCIVWQVQYTITLELIKSVMHCTIEWKTTHIKHASTFSEFADVLAILMPACYHGWLLVLTCTSTNTHNIKFHYANIAVN